MLDIAMRLKGLLLGSAAVAVAVICAKAADLPTRKAEPVQSVQICNVGGVAGWINPGANICVRFGGYITGQFLGGNLATQYNWGSTAGVAAVTGVPFPRASGGYAWPALLVRASEPQGNTSFYREAVGWTTVSNFGFDLASNTAYGPLIGHFDINSNNGNGFNNGGNNTYLNTGYLTWAGITAGKAQSFYSFIGGGDNWGSLLSPDQRGYNQPDLLAYTASFGGGFTATLALQGPGANGTSGNGTQMGAPGFVTVGGNQGEFGGFNPLNITFGGQRWPDIVGALHVKQNWGEAQLSGVLHNVNVVDNVFSGGVVACGPTFLAICDGSQTKTGWGVDAGVKVNLPAFGQGDNVVLTGAYTKNAVWYSGLPDGMVGENGQVNGNGQPMYVADAFFNPITNTWAAPTAWSVSGLYEHHFTPQFYAVLEGSVGGLNWSNQGGCGSGAVLSGACPFYAAGGPLSPHAFTWIAGADLGWNPVRNLNFDVELMYQSTYQDKPNGVIGTIYNFGTPSQYFIPGAWEGDSSGFAGRLRITRYF
jgi:hypothetical protein